MRIVIASCLALTLLLSGCFKVVTDESAMPPRPRYTGTAPWGIDGLRPGQTLADAVKLFGEPSQPPAATGPRFLRWFARDTMVTLDAKDVITEVYGHTVTAGGQVLVQGGDDQTAVTQVLGPGDVRKSSRPKGSGVISLGRQHVGTTVIYEQAGVRFELPVWGEATGHFWARRMP